jgi:hypothetical protein
VHAHKLDALIEVERDDTEVGSARDGVWIKRTYERLR